LKNYVQSMGLRALRLFDQALPPHRQALTDTTRLLGESHPLTILLMGDLAGLLEQTGKMEEAVTLVRRAMMLGEQSAMRWRLVMAEGYHKLADHLARNGNHAEAAESYGKAAEVAKKNSKHDLWREFDEKRQKARRDDAAARSPEGGAAQTSPGSDPSTR
jgi:tetratricopeptide (TPR) repeat protein